MSLARRMARLELELDQRSDRLVAVGDDGTTPAPSSAPLRAEVVRGPQPTDTHRRLVELLEQVLTMGGAASGGNPMLKASLRTIRKLQPVALEELARVPEAEVRAFLNGLVRQLTTAIGEGVEDGICPSCGQAVDVGANESQGTGTRVLGRGDTDRKEHTG